MNIEVLRGSSGYPARLEKLGDAPSRLRICGQIPEMDYAAIVGTRHPDGRMLRLARMLARQLSERGVGVLSGGALGIDAAAHEGALEAEGVTVAVIGSGLAHLHPKTNRRIFDRMVTRGGIVSEFKDSQRASRWTFPRRNRIVAAMAKAVVVVQAPMKSGALITAQMAARIGVPVGSVPFDAGAADGAGGNQLIKNGARLIETVDDIITLMNTDTFKQQLPLVTMGNRPPKPPLPDALQISLTPSQQAIFNALSQRPISIDAIIEQVDMPASAVLATLMEMELLGHVDDVGGKRFVRNQ